MTASADPGSVKDSDRLEIVALAQGTTSRIELAGECDLAAQTAVRAAIRELLAGGPECVVLDLSRVSFMDSTGIEIVVELTKRAERDKFHLVIVPGPRAVQHIFEVCGLLSMLPFLPEP